MHIPEKTLKGKAIAAATRRKHDPHNLQFVHHKVVFALCTQFMTLMS